MFLIRKAVIGDEGHLARLAQMVQNLHVAHRPDQFKTATVEDLTAWYRAQIDTSAAAIWIAEADGKGVGYALAAFQERPSSLFVQARYWCELDQLAVDPGWQRRGIASELVRAVLDDAASRGLAEVGLTVWEFNSAARALFGRLGFSPRVTRLERKISG